MERGCLLRVVMDHGCEQRLGAALLAVADNKKLLSALKVVQERYLGKKNGANQAFRYGNRIGEPMTIYVR